MRAESSAIDRTGIAVSTGIEHPASAPPRSPAPADRRSGTLQAALGVTAFSLTFPATAWGLEGFGPWSLVTVRCVLAAVLAGGCLLALRVPGPPGGIWRASPSSPPVSSSASRS